MRQIFMIWIMEGLSSQRSLISGTKAWIEKNGILNPQGKMLQIIASHRAYRPEITNSADIALEEPTEQVDKIEFMIKILNQYPIEFIHVGRNCSWYEERRAIIEQQGAQLITGALSLESFQIADDKYRFTKMLEEQGIAVTPAKYVETLEQLRQAIDEMKQEYGTICIKPNKGIYGIGFWILNDKGPQEKGFFSPEMHQINTTLYLNVIQQTDMLPEPLLVMPYLPGPESSIDLVVRAGRTIAALGRRKINGFQELFTEGSEIDLAIHCSQLLNADGLVNVQTREDAQGQLRVLETNLRPSGGFGYSLVAQVNLASVMFADRYNCTIPKCMPNASKIKVLDQPIIIS